MAEPRGALELDLSDVSSGCRQLVNNFFSDSRRDPI